MGVAVGRVLKTSGLKIVNYNSSAASLKHPQDVYDFYFRWSQEPKDDLSCCIKDIPNNCEEISFLSESEEPTNQTEPGPLPGPSNVKIAPCPLGALLNFI